MSRKLLFANLTIVVLLLGLGAIQAGHKEPSGAPRESGKAVTTLTVNASNLLLVQGFESSQPFVVEQGYAPSYGPPSPGSGAYWGRSVARALAGMFSVWCAGAGPASPAQPPYGANCIPMPPYPSPCHVPPDTNTTMTTGPYDLSDYTAGTLSFWLWLSAPTTNRFSIQASIDRHNFFGYSYYGEHSGRLVASITTWPALGNLAGRPQVWFRFGYSSDSAGTFEGVYIDDVRLEVSGPDLIFGDSFELGDTSAWSQTVP